MLKKTLIWLLILVSSFCSCSDHKTSTQIVLPSPDSQTHIYFNLNDGEPYYLVYHKGKMIINWSLLGLKLKNQIDFSEGLTLINTESASTNSADLLDLDGGYSVLQQYNEIIVFLSKSQSPDDTLQIVLKAYNNGIGINYIFSGTMEESSVFEFIDNTQINLAGEDDFRTITETTDILEAPLQKSYRLPVLLRFNESKELIITEEVLPGVAQSVLEIQPNSNREYRLKPAGSEIFSLHRASEGFVTPMRTIIFKDLSQQSFN